MLFNFALCFICCVFYMSAAEPQLTLTGAHEQVEDYRSLSSAFDWTLFFSNKFSENKIELNLLDVGCGTGRWITEFSKIIPFQFRGKIQCDLVDPSSYALNEAALRLQPPLKLNASFSELIQNVNLKPDHYDVVWAIHSFYAIPNGDLDPVILQLIESLTSDGDLLIVLASQPSFYIQCYDTFRSCYELDQLLNYTTANDLLEAFHRLNLTPEITKVLFYEEVQKNDFLKLNHYILNECIGYSFDRDENLTSDFSMTDLLTHPKMGKFLQQYEYENSYKFPQEYWILRFNKVKN